MRYNEGKRARSFSWTFCKVCGASIIVGAPCDFCAATALAAELAGRLQWDVDGSPVSYADVCELIRVCRDSSERLESLDGMEQEALVVGRSEGMLCMGRVIHATRL
jgi:hypothetical protein